MMNLAAAANDDGVMALPAALTDALGGGGLSRRTDSSDMVTDAGVLWEGLQAEGSPSSALILQSAQDAQPQQHKLPLDVEEVDVEVVVDDSQAERERIGRVLNLAAQQGYPSPNSRSRRVTQEPGHDFGIASPGHNDNPTPSPRYTRDDAHNEQHNCDASLDDDGALQEEVELASSAALCALMRFQFCTVASVTRQMRSCAYWGHYFSNWAPECVIALIEFALLNGWIKENDGSWV
jgi:hypothetical protein